MDQLQKYKYDNNSKKWISTDDIPKGNDDNWVDYTVKDSLGTQRPAKKIKIGDVCNIYHILYMSIIYILYSINPQ